MTATAIKERPILFSAPMIKALLEGRKTQTRRIVKAVEKADDQLIQFFPAQGEWGIQSLGLRNAFEKLNCPYGKPGDRLWVKETHLRNGEDVMYRDDPEWDLCEPRKGEKPGGLVWRKVSSLFMPRTASRITLEITDVRAQRVDEISEEDAISEGMLDRDAAKKAGGGHFLTPRLRFLDLFYNINERAPRGSNPWVWALTFKVVK